MREVIGWWRSATAFERQYFVDMLDTTCASILHLFNQALVDDVFEHLRLLQILIQLSLETHQLTEAMRHLGTHRLCIVQGLPDAGGALLQQSRGFTELTRTALAFGKTQNRERFRDVVFVLFDETVFYLQLTENLTKETLHRRACFFSLTNQSQDLSLENLICIWSGCLFNPASKYLDSKEGNDILVPETYLCQFDAYLCGKGNDLLEKLALNTHTFLYFILFTSTTHHFKCEASCFISRFW